jgi:hypothetical protein
MSAGRCSGCGLENKSCRVIRSHINTCPEYVALYRDPETRPLALDPEDEYVKHQAYLKSPEGQAEKDERRAARSAEHRDITNARNAAAAEQWGGTQAPAGVDSGS